MYLPIFRGRQFELLALRECVDKELLNANIIPIIEPVKVSSTYIKTIDSFIQKQRRIAIILNPIVGSWNKDIQKENNVKIRDSFQEQLKNEYIVPVLYVTPDLKNRINDIYEIEKSIESTIVICNNPEYINSYTNVIGAGNPLFSVIPDKGDFRRKIRTNRVLCEDHFPKRMRNIDYLENEDEFFSSDHLFYSEDGYKGFSDYSVVGEEYNEVGFAPYAVAIHIVYFDAEQNLRIAHFVSDSNDDISDPAGKFAEAVEKLVEWNYKIKLDTDGIREFEKAFERKTYPGLGVVKKYSIMHHLELMSKYLGSEQI